MDKIYVVYWSQSGNTQAMAEAVGKGIADAGKEAAVICVGDAKVFYKTNTKNTIKKINYLFKTLIQIS